MKAEIINGILEIYPQSKTEEFALEEWWEKNVNKCTRETNGRNISFCSTDHPHNKFWFRLKLKLSRL